MNNGFRLFVSGVMAVLAGCDSGQSPAQLRAYLQALQVPLDKVVAPVPSVEPRAVFVYEAGALRSPFQVRHEVNGSSWQASLVDEALESNRFRHLLEGFDLEQFEMVGTLSNDLEAHALLRVNGVVHRVKVGDYLGRNNGQIASVEATRVEVFEVRPDGRGGWLERSLTIPLKQQS